MISVVWFSFRFWGHMYSLRSFCWTVHLLLGRHTGPWHISYSPLCAAASWSSSCCHARKGPWGWQSSSVPFSQNPAEPEMRVFLISTYVWDTFNEAINSLIYTTKYVPDYNNFQSLPIWSGFKPVVDFQKQFENQNQLSNQIFQSCK